MNRRLLMPLTLLAIVVFYMAVFAAWWVRSPRYTRVVGGRQVHYLEFHYNFFSWHTRPVWIPALWVARRTGGYHELGLVAAYEDSVILYAR